MEVDLFPWLIRTTMFFFSARPCRAVCRHINVEYKKKIENVKIILFCSKRIYIATFQYHLMYGIYIVTHTHTRMHARILAHTYVQYIRGFTFCHGPIIFSVCACSCGEQLMNSVCVFPSKIAFFYNKSYQLHNIALIRNHVDVKTCKYSILMSRDRRFPTMWYVRRAKPQISLRICAV